jgi:hypothetical protein
VPPPSSPLSFPAPNCPVPLPAPKATEIDRELTKSDGEVTKGDSEPLDTSAQMASPHATPLTSVFSCASEMARTFLKGKGGDKGSKGGAGGGNSVENPVRGRLSLACLVYH